MNYRTLKVKTALALTVGTLLSASQGWAATTEEFQFDQVVVTADRITETVGTTPGSVTVITADELKNKGARTLADALAGIPGVNIQNYGGPGSTSIPYILGTDRVVLLVDGKRMNLPQGIGSGSGGVNLNFFLLDGNIDRIEIVQGGGSVLYGADAVGGVINIITKKGTDTTRTTTTVAAGNYGARYYALTTGGQEQNTRWQLSGAQDSTDGQRSNSAYKGKDLSLRLDQDLSQEKSLTFNYDYYGSHAGIPGSLIYPQPTDFQDVLRRDWSVGYTREHDGGNQVFRFYDNDQLYTGENYGSFRNANTVQGFEYQDSLNLDTANLLTWGTEWRKEKVLSTAESDVLHDDITKAVYLQDQYSFNAAAKMTIGLRQDNSSIYGSHTLPQAGYIYQANGTTSYFANLKKVFKAPKFDDLYGNDGYGDTGNPNLKPETGWTAETGVKTKLSAVSEATLSLFKRNFRDAIVWMEAADYTFHPQNISQLNASGVNASLITQLSPATSADFGYTYLDSRDQDGNSIGDPRHTFHIGLNIHDGKLTQSIYGIYQAAQLPSNEISLNQVPAHFIVNTNTNFNLKKDTAVFLTIQNLFNRQYQDVQNYPADGRTILIGIRQTL